MFKNLSDVIVESIINRLADKLIEGKKLVVTVEFQDNTDKKRSK